MRLLKKYLKNDGQLLNIFEIKWGSWTKSPLKSSDYSACPLAPPPGLKMFINYQISVTLLKLLLVLLLNKVNQFSELYPNCPQNYSSDIYVESELWDILRDVLRIIYSNWTYNYNYSLRTVGVYPIYNAHYPF